MSKYLQDVKNLVGEFPSWSITKIPRAENSKAHRLSEYASVAIPNPKMDKEKIFVEYLPDKSTSESSVEVMDI